MEIFNTDITRESMKKRVFRRSIAAATLVLFVSTSYLIPVVQAVEGVVGSQAEKQFNARGKSDEAKLAYTLQSVKDGIADTKKRVDERVEEEGDLIEWILNLLGLSQLQKEPLDQLLAINEQMEDLHQQALVNYDDIERQLVEKEVPEDILQRHHDAVASYQDEYELLQQYLQESIEVDSLLNQQDSVNRLNEFLERHQFKRPRQQLDPSDLPFSMKKPGTRTAPFSSGEQISKYIERHEMGKGIESQLLTASREVIGGLVKPAHAETSQFDAEDLAETTEVQLTAAIRQKAQELDNNPVKILNWVRNNTQWIPGWGATQDSEHTLSSRRGNSFDNSTLLIALLRAANIPAKYVHGVIDVPIEKLRLWAGNFDSNEAALDFVGASSVPIAAVTSAGAITKARLEHVWVEAYVDFEPSRGSDNTAGDTWVAMDPSFKEYEQLQVPNVESINEIDINQVNQNFIDSGAQNTSEGWVQNIDLSVFEQLTTLTTGATDAIRNAEQSFFNQNFLNSGNEGVNIPDLLAGYRVVETSPELLSSGLPYEQVNVLTRYAEIPSAYQAQYEIGFGKDIFGGLVNSISLPVSQVNSEKLTLTFTFASESDHDALASFFPDGDITSLSQLPQSFPGYLINFIPEIKLNGVTILKGTAMRFGSDFSLGYSFRFPGAAPTKTFFTELPVGSHVGIGTIVGSVNVSKFAEVGARLDDASVLLDTAATDEEVLEQAFNIHNQIASDTYYLGILDYLGKQFATAEIFGRAAQLGEVQLLSSGVVYGYVPEVSYFFGVPRTVGMGSISVDAQHLLFAIEANDGDQQKRFNLAMLIGMYGSALEGDAPTQLFALDDDNPTQGYSAANNIKLALEQGQRVYLLNSTNRDELANINFSAEVMSEIRTAIDSGLEVIAHTDPLVSVGTNGNISTAGYIVRDPVQGTAAYLLDSGTNGGKADIADEMLASCAYTNRPEFVFNDNDAARFRIMKKCANASRGIKEEMARNKREANENKLGAIQNYMEVYAKAPMVIADCMVAGAPQAFLQLINLLRTSAAMLAINTAMIGVASVAGLSEDLSEILVSLMDEIEELCDALRTASN